METRSNVKPPSGTPSDAKPLQRSALRPLQNHIFIDLLRERLNISLFRGCENATIHRIESNRRPRELRAREVRSVSQISEYAPPPRPSYHQRVFGSLIRNFRSVYDYLMNFGRDRRDALMQQVPENSVSNLIKMILLPILLLVIVVMMVPLVENVTFQTFNAIFYNDRVPDDRGAMLKRISVGISLIFDHVIKKLFPVVRLRWANRKLFKRRVQVLPPAPQPIIP